MDSGIRAVALGARALAFLACVLVAYPAFAQSGGVMSRQQLEALLAESGKALDNLRAARNQSVPKALANRDDRRGLTFKDDLQQNVLTPEAESRLKSMAATAETQLRVDDASGAQLTLASMRRELTVEIERFKAITAYWTETSSLKPHPADFDTAARNDMLRANGFEPPPASVETASLEQRFYSQIASREFTQAMTVTWPALRAARELARSEEARLVLARLETGAPTPLAAVQPTRKCVPAKETSHTAHPLIRTSNFPSTADYYTEKMAAAGLEGPAEVFVIADERGCPERVALIGTAGHAERDSAALQMAADGYYRPAEKNGAASRDTFTLRILWTSPNRKRR